MSTNNQTKYTAESLHALSDAAFNRVIAELDGWPLEYECPAGNGQARIAEDTSVTAQVLSKLAYEGHLATFKPAPRCVMYNEQEVYHVLRREGLL